MKPLLIMKTGSTLESLRARGEDFHGNPPIFSWGSQ